MVHLWKQTIRAILRPAHSFMIVCDLYVSELTQRMQTDPIGRWAACPSPFTHQLCVCPVRIRKEVVKISSLPMRMDRQLGD